MLTHLLSIAFVLFAMADGSFVQNTQGLAGIDTNVVKKLNDSAHHYAYINTDSCLLLANKAFKYAVQIGDRLGEANAMLNLTRAYYIKGKYDKALMYGTKVYEISKKIGYEYGIAFSLNNAGLIYLSQENYKAALIEFNKSIVANKRDRNFKALAGNYFNIALCHIGEHDLKQATLALNESILLCRKSDNQRVLIMATNRLGDVAFKKGEIIASITLFNAAIKLNIIKDEWEYAFSYTGMATSLYELRRYEEAIASASRALNDSQKLQAYWDMQRASNILHKSYAAINDYKNAYKYLDLDKKYSDSLYNEKKEREVNLLHLKRKQVENEDLQYQIQIKQQKNKVGQLVIIMVSAVSLFLIVLIGIVFRNNLKIKSLNKQLVKNNNDIAIQNEQILEKNTQLASLNYSKDQLFSVIGHDLRSPIVSIVQAVNLLRSRDLSTDEARYILDSFFEKLTATATMLDNLLLWANNQMEEVSVDRTHFLLPELTNQLLLVLNFQANEKQVEIKHEVRGDAFVAADVNHARIILQNLISNAIKFTPSGGYIYIHYFIKPDKVGIVIRDTGVGIKKDKIRLLFNVTGQEISTYGTADEKGIGIGLMLVKKYADQNNAQVIVNSDETGTEFVVCFDIAGH
jgi:signal transduction histidine kinase